MDDDHARALLRAERSRIEGLLGHEDAAGAADAAAANEPGDMTDPAEPLIDEELDAAVASSLQERLVEIGRAEQRLANGTFGRSVLSGLPISEERLEVNPAAELTAEEAREQR